MEALIIPPTKARQHSQPIAGADSLVLTFVLKPFISCVILVVVNHFV